MGQFKSCSIRFLRPTIIQRIQGSIDFCSKRKLKAVGDLHYSNQKQFIPKVKNPQKKKDKERNREIEGVRSSVENTISRLKDWKSLNLYQPGFPTPFLPLSYPFPTLSYPFPTHFLPGN